MELTDKQQKFQAEVREFCLQEIEPHAAGIDRGGVFPQKIMDRVADFGLFGCVVPKEYGGLGVDTVSYAIAVEEVSRVCGSTGITVAAHNSLGVMPFLLFGNEQQKEKYVPWPSCDAINVDISGKSPMTISENLLNVHTVNR